jgi:hypothetical protein
MARLLESVNNKLLGSINSFLESHKNDTGRAEEIRDKRLNETLKNEIAAMILNEMGDVYRRVKAGQIAITESIRREITGFVVPALFASHEQLELAREEVDKFINMLDRRPRATFAYTFKRQDMASDYSVMRLLYEQSFFRRPMKLVWNAGFSLYHDPDPMMNQQTWRDFSTALSLEGKVNSPFLKETPDLSKMTFSLNGRYQRLRENKGMPMKKADIGVVQFKMEIPLMAGVSIPLSVSYATSTEQLDEKHTQGHFGFTFDLDKFAAVTRLLKR